MSTQPDTSMPHYGGEKPEDLNHLVKVQEFDKTHLFWIRRDATCYYLGLAIQKSLNFPIQLQRIWSPREMTLIRPALMEFQDIPIIAFASKTVVLFGRHTKNTIQPNFFLSNPVRNINLDELFEIAEWLAATRWNRAIESHNSERTSVCAAFTNEGMKIRETSKFQQRFKRLPNLYGTEANPLVYSYCGQTKRLLDAYIGTGIIPRLFCDHVQGPNVEACEMCISLFVVEWLVFAKHIRSTEEMLCGRKAYALHYEALKADMTTLQEYVIQLTREGKTGITLGISGILGICIFDFLEDLELHEFLTPEKCHADGVVNDVESLLQVLELITDFDVHDGSEGLPSSPEKLFGNTEALEKAIIRELDKVDQPVQQKYDEKKANEARVKAINEAWQELTKHPRQG